MKKNLLTLVVYLFLAMSMFSQTGMYESNIVHSLNWDEDKQEYVENGQPVVSSNWKMYFDSKKTKSMILVVNDVVVAVEVIIDSGSFDKYKYHDGNGGTRIMYIKDDNVFLVYTEKNSSGRYEVMYAFRGEFKKMSKKKYKASIDKHEVKLVDDGTRQI